MKGVRAVSIKRLKQLLKKESFDSLNQFLVGQTAMVNKDGETYIFDDDLFRWMKGLPVID